MMRRVIISLVSLFVAMSIEAGERIIVHVNPKQRDYVILSKTSSGMKVRIELTLEITSNQPMLDKHIDRSHQFAYGSSDSTGFGFSTAVFYLGNTVGAAFPRGSISDLFNPSELELFSLPGDQLILHIRGGDGGSSYRASIELRPHGVVERVVGKSKVNRDHSAFMSRDKWSERTEYFQSPIPSEYMRRLYEYCELPLKRRKELEGFTRSQCEDHVSSDYSRFK
jgi:hypothetical protein